jgi:signal transduction histidine kinase
MSALTSSISHELGQPLSSILYNAQALDMMVSADRATPETVREILADIQGQGLRATQIIDRHRMMLKTHQLEKKKVDLLSVIGETIALVDHDMRARGIEAAVDMPVEPCVVNGDQVLLQQVFVNLVMNAMDAMAETPPDLRRVTISSRVISGSCEIAVRDNGTGLPAQIDGRLFAPFVTTKAHGMGIGLTIVQTIVHTHRGTIEARNNPDGGATFAVTLPLAVATNVTPGIQ